MKKLYLLVITLLLVPALALPAYADVPSMGEILFSPNEGLPYVLLCAAIIAAGVVLYKLLKKRGK